MKLKEGFVLRRILGEAIVVAEGELSKSFHGMIKLNDTAADIWECLSEGKSEGEIASLLSEKYGIPEEKAKADIKDLAEKLFAAGIMESSEKKSIEQIIAEEGKFVCTTSGESMMPLFADRRDNVIIIPKSKRLRKYDVPLYRRGEEYVLHRVIKVLPDSYVIRGDNCDEKEKGITDDAIVGVLSGFYRKNKYYGVNNLSYRIYSVFIVALWPALSFVRRAKRKLKSVFEKR